MYGAIFGCHQTRKLPEGQQQVCGGWLLDQKRRGLPSIQLRIYLMTTPEADKAVADVTDGGAELYDSIAEMAAANGVFP